MSELKRCSRPMTPGFVAVWNRAADLAVELDSDYFGLPHFIGAFIEYSAEQYGHDANKAVA